MIYLKEIKDRSPISLTWYFFLSHLIFLINHPFKSIFFSVTSIESCTWR